MITLENLLLAVLSLAYLYVAARVVSRAIVRTVNEMKE